MSKDLIFKRVLNNKCPISDKTLKGEETEIVQFNEAKLTVIKRYIKIRKN